MKIMKKIDASFKYDEISEKVKDANTNWNALKNYGVERMTVDRGSCFSCGKKFLFYDVIVFRIVFDSQTALKYGRDVKWNHLKCFAEKREFLRYQLGGSLLTGFEKLNEADRNLVTECLP